MDNLRYEDSYEERFMHVALEYIAVHLAPATRFVQEQSNCFQSILKTIDLRLFLTQIGGVIDEAWKAFSQNITASMSTWARLQADNASYIPTATWFLSRPIMSIAGAFLLASVGFLFTTEFGLFLLIGSYVCMADPMMCWILLGVGRLASLLISLRRGRISSSTHRFA